MDADRIVSRYEPGVMYAVASQVVHGPAAFLPVEAPVVIRSQVAGIHVGSKGAADQPDLADFSGFDQLLRLQMARVVAKLEGLGEEDAMFPCGFDHGPAFGRRRTDGLFAQNRLHPARPRGPDADIRVRVAPGADGQDIEVFPAQHALEIRVTTRDAKGLAESSQRVLGDVADCGQFRFRSLLCRPAVAMCDTADTNDAHLEDHGRPPVKPDHGMGYSHSLKLTLCHLHRIFH